MACILLGKRKETGPDTHGPDLHRRLPAGVGFGSASTPVGVSAGMVAGMPML